jgi:endonuclease YncB( thermonuclease family)
MARRNRPVSGRRPRRMPRAQAFAGTAVALLVLLGPRLGDVVNAGVTRSDGCRIYAIVDGDTVRMHCPGSGFRVTRLTGFDTPEFRAECGRELIMAYLATHACGGSCGARAKSRSASGGRTASTGGWRGSRWTASRCRAG